MDFVSGVMNTYTTNPYQYENNVIPSYEVFNTTVQYKWNDNLKLYGGIDNLLNKDFPNNAGPSTQPFSGVGGASYYDRIGRRFKVGARFNF
jgi:outer membrane receptor for ferrienterochelin and colicin